MSCTIGPSGLEKPALNGFQIYSVFSLTVSLLQASTAMPPQIPVLEATHPHPGGQPLHPAQGALHQPKQHLQPNQPLPNVIYAANPLPSSGFFSGHQTADQVFQSQSYIHCICILQHPSFAFSLRLMSVILNCNKKQLREGEKKIVKKRSG